MGARNLIEAILMEEYPGGRSGYIGGTTPPGGLVMRSVPDVLDVDHSELGVRQNRFRWAKGAPDTVLWTGAPEDDEVEEKVAYALERKTGRTIARHRFYPDGWDTWVSRVTAA